MKILTQKIKQMAIGAIELIQKEAATFVAHVKIGYDGVDDDLVTTADIAAQKYYQEEIENQYPEEGMIGEEKLNKPSANGRYFTIDPLDGTKAFGRRQSNGVGTMIAHVNENNVVDAAAVGDINTGELYYFGPDVAPTRVRFGTETFLPTTENRTLDSMYVLLREHPDMYLPEIQKLIRTCAGIYVESGSIGIMMSKLWKGEIGMVILLPTFETPWDSSPLIGMNAALNVVHLKLDPKTMHVEEYVPFLPKEVVERTHIEILVRREHVTEIMMWAEKLRMMQ